MTLLGILPFPISCDKEQGFSSLLLTVHVYIACSYVFSVIQIVEGCLFEILDAAHISPNGEWSEDGYNDHSAQESETKFNADRALIGELTYSTY